ncbi:hypothetical protein MMC27_001862 [Xylographa pallens]|nr:hypothetical protein [Xylographa pallens]
MDDQEIFGNVALMAEITTWGSDDEEYMAVAGKRTALDANMDEEDTTIIRPKPQVSTKRRNSVRIAEPITSVLLNHRKLRQEELPTFT